MAAGQLMAACGAERPDVAPDKEPPEVTVMSDVPLFTRDRSLTLKIQASDLMGVKHVWYSVNNGSPIEVWMSAPQRAGALSVVSGTFEARLAANTQNVLAIWAEDYEGNSGVSGQPPYMTGLTIIQDDTALGVSLNGAAKATYYDESKMTVGTDEVYEPNGARLELIGPGETIHKAATRLAARPPATTSAADLEGANPDNIPWLQFAVTLTGGPVETATYTIEATVGSTTNEYTGDLLAWRSPGSSPNAMTGTVNFNLPLDSVRIPILETATGVVGLKVTVGVADAAGNQGGDEVKLKYAVIGPPLHIVVDEEYPKPGTLNSTEPHKIADGTYGRLFDASDRTTFGPTQQIRLVRLVVTNPSPQPVALDVSSITDGSWRMTETWTGKRKVGEPVEFNNSTCPPSSEPATNHRKMWARAGGSPIEHEDPGTDQFALNQVVATSNLSSLAELDNKAAVEKAGTRYIVPAADGSAPGEISLYITRPLGVSRAGVPALGTAPDYTYTNDVGTFYTYVSQRDAASGCCLHGYRQSMYYVYHYYMDTDLFRISNDYCSIYDFGSTPLVGSASLTRTRYVAYCEPGPISSPYCPDGWLQNDNGAPLAGGSNGGRGTPCTNCLKACSCSQRVQAQTYSSSVYFQELSSASETAAAVFTPVTQPVDDGGSLYGVENSGAARIPISASFTH
jgi:hypothetical protein